MESSVDSGISLNKDMRGRIVFWKPSLDNGLHAALMQKNSLSCSSSDPVK